MSLKNIVLYCHNKGEQTMKKHIQFLLGSMIFMALGAQQVLSQADLTTDIKRAGEALRRYMESAHPTPDIGKDLPMTPMIPMITNALTNPSFF